MRTRKNRIVFATLVLALIFSEAWAARPYTPVHPDPVLEPWRWRSFPELNGLGLWCMAEARDKAMWFGVDDGVRRYDGVKWTAYTEKDGLYGAPVNALCAARDGSIYAGTEKGISRFRDGKWSRVFPPEGNLPWPIFDLMEAKDGSVWAGTDWGALRLGQEGSTLYTTEQMGATLSALAPYVQLSIVPDEAAPARPWSHPYAWLTGEGIGVFAVSSKNAVIGALAPGGPGELAGLKVGDRIMAMDGQPTGDLPPKSGDGSPLLFRLWGPAGVSVRLTIQRENRPEPFEMTVNRRQVKGTFREFGVYDIYEDRDGIFWFGMWSGEVVRYDPSTGSGQGIRRSQADSPASWRLYTKEEGLYVSGGPRIAQTRDGVIWKVSDDNIYGGVNRFDGNTWSHFRLSELGGNDINTSILETKDGTLWVGGNGLHAFRDEAWRVYRFSEVSIPSHRTRLLEASDGALWVAGSGQEAARMDYGPTRWTTYKGLIFQCETPDGAQWFVSQDNGIVRYDGQSCMRYGVEDGLMDSPNALLATRKGELWAAGSHDSTAATARFDGKRWSLQTHPRLSWGINQVYESSDGSLYFGAAGDVIHERGQLGGVLRFDGKTLRQSSGQAWTHYTPPKTPLTYSIGQSADGLLYFGGSGLVRFDGQGWTRITEPKGLASWVHAIYGTDKGDLYVGTRAYGVFRFDGKTWKQYNVRDGLAEGQVNSIFQTADGSIYVATQKGISRFDGQTWTTHALAVDFPAARLQQSRDGAIWINSFSTRGRRARPGGPLLKETSDGLRTIRYQPDAVPPETEITVSLDRVSQPGNTVLAWTGADPWKATPDEEVQYSHRMDGGEWSPFSHEKNKVFLSLPSGAHTFEVRARDRDFNVDPTPAAIRFTVVPPIWRQPWFIGLVLAFVGITTFQASRIVIRDRRLREANAALSSANKDLFGLNQELQQKTEDLEKANAQVQEATERKSRFLASMSHELRTPMNAIIGFTRLVLRREGDRLSERQRENLVKVQQASDHLLSLINDILDLSKVEAGRVEVKPVQFDVRALIASCCSTVNPLVRPGVALNYEVADDVGEAHTDEARLRQIVINLLSNALKFTESGEVKVIVRPSPRLAPLGFPSPINGRGVDRAAGRGEGLSPSEISSEDKPLEIAVSDTGVGIPADSLGLIFEEFRQVAGAHQTQKGTGLGLAITKKLTELLGGTIEVSSEVGKGSVFTVRIPVVYQGN